MHHFKSFYHFECLYHFEHFYHFEFHTILNNLPNCFCHSCHLVTVPPGPALADALRSSPIIHGEDGYTPAANFGSGFDDVDPNLDPELALVSWFCQ